MLGNIIRFFKQGHASDYYVVFEKVSVINLNEDVAIQLQKSLKEIEQNLDQFRISMVLPMVVRGEHGFTFYNR